MGFLNTYRFSNGKAQYFFSLFSYIYSSIFIGRHESGFKKNNSIIYSSNQIIFCFFGCDVYVCVFSHFKNPFCYFLVEN